MDELLTPTNSDDLNKFCSSLSSFSPIVIEVMPEDFSEELKCFENVEKKVSLEGGSPIFGWAIVERPQFYLEAQFHCVWQSPEGAIVDLTPTSLSLPVTLFQIAENQACTGNTIPSSIYPLAQAALVDRYILLMNSLNMKIKEFKNLGIDAGSEDPRLNEIAPIIQEMEHIKDSVKCSPTKQSK